MRVLALKGYKSLRAFNAFHALMLGVKMLPMYMGETYEEFFSKVQLMPPKDQEIVIRQAAQFVELSEDEVKALVCFCIDKNGVPYGPENLKNLSPADLIEIIVSVCLEIVQIKIDFVSEAEKKTKEFLCGPASHFCKTA